MPAPEKLLDSQQTETYYQDMLKSVIGSDSRLTIEEDGFICQKASLNVLLIIMMLEALILAMHFNIYQPIAVKHPG